MGEVRKIPHEFARTRGNTHQQTKKIPNSDELGILYWWWNTEPNPRPLSQPDSNASAFGA